MPLNNPYILLHLRSGQAGLAPTVGDLQEGQIAVNTYDGALYTKTVQGATESVATINGRKAQVDIYTASGTWTKPVGASAVEIILVGGGGGGGSGRVGAAASTVGGGGGGGGAGTSQRLWRASDLAATVVCVVGAGGAGGSAVATVSTNGNAGGAGGESYIEGTIGGSTFRIQRAGGGNGAGGGTTAGGSAGSGGLFETIGQSGAIGSANRNASSTSVGNFAAGGGGGGGGIQVNGQFADGGSANSPYWTNRASTGGTLTDAATCTYAAPLSGAQIGWLGTGGGGGSANSSNACSGQAGAAGGLYGGGGGGGGAAINGASSGAGGAGAGGVVAFITYF